MGSVVVLAAITLVSARRAPVERSDPPPPETGTGVPRALGALQGLGALHGPLGAGSRDRLLGAADEAAARQPSPTEVLEVEETDGPFVTDAQDAWTLALARHVTGQQRYGEAAAAIVDGWVDTAQRLQGACEDSGACSTSLMVSRAAPALVFAVDLLRVDGAFTPGQTERFHRWLGRVVLPAASDRENNWGDAGTYLRAAVGAELGDQELLGDVADRWRERLDLIGADGQIPEEIRRGRASLMYSQDALDYKVATADLLDRAGIDVWNEQGERGGTLRAALDLVATGLRDPGEWPVDDDDLRVPDPSGCWAIAAHRWPDVGYEELADAASAGDGTGHSAVLWTGITHAAGR